ncbi:MAG: hypothetical protein AVDCRST_MAG73-2068 [uncultured Thermomicrobiales bacterium]|uniref:Ribbon-helix-helix protein CopG domain-containing protein n=1 Tax=uncultured Thermomicrobiales bacterium TaxID=1645740 RepID=A0A6J4U6I6_9BACT|nr:MAG: hypothetical protein AVDCRST_MAG73-2068 [uncultured Thermomicrobiales bacterium]
MASAAPRRTWTISIPAELAEEVDGWVKHEQSNRSALVAGILAEERRRRFEIQLEQDYRDAMADGHFDDIGFYVAAQAEVVLRGTD